MIWTLLREEIAGVTRPVIRVPLSSNSRGFCFVCVGVMDRPIWLGSVIVSRNAGWFTVHISDHWRSLFKLAGGFRLLGCSGDTFGIVTLKLRVLISLNTQANTHSDFPFQLSESPGWGQNLLTRCMKKNKKIKKNNLWISHLFVLDKQRVKLKA